MSQVHFKNIEPLQHTYQPSFEIVKSYVKPKI